MAKEKEQPSWYYDLLVKHYGKEFAKEHKRTKGRGPSFERGGKGYWKTRLGKPRNP